MTTPTPLRNSIGIWAFGPAATRFVPSGYHPEATAENMLDKTKRVADGLHDLVDGVEYHYPGEVSEDNVEAIVTELKAHDMRLPVVASGLHPNPIYGKGSLVNPDPKLRKQAIEVNLRAVDLAAAVGASFIVWPGSEGYNYSFQRDYVVAWDLFVDGIASITARAAAKGVKVFLEHKNSEPAMKILMRNIGMTLFVIHKVAARGVDTSGLLVNMDWQHLIMNGENLAEYAALLAAQGRLGHQHGNDGWGAFDDDNVVGTNFFMQTLELALTLQDISYGTKGEWLGFDLYPYTEDQIGAVRRAVLQWEFIWDVARKIDRDDLAEARGRADALAGQRAVYAALGLDDAYEAEIIRRRSRTSPKT